MDINTINTIFLTGATLIVVCLLLSRPSSKLGIPILLVVLVVGMIAGEDGLGQIEFNNHALTYFICNLALAIILLEGGMQTSIARFRVALWPSLSLATIGVVVTSSFTGLMAIWLFDLTIFQGLLVGALVGSTDAAVVFSMLKGQRLNDRVGSTLEIESGTNDPMAVFLTVTLISMLSSSEASIGVSYVATNFALQFGVGSVVGLVGGMLLWKLINRIELQEGMYSVLTIGSGVAIFALSNKLGGSGILSIYLLGLLLGNKPIRYRYSILRVLDGLTWLCQITMFLVLGLLVTPSTLVDIMMPALVLAFGLIFLARPIAVWVGLFPFRRYTVKELIFISWVGLRGAVPIILAVFPLMAGLDNAQLYFNIAFFVVIVSLLVQGSSLVPIARLTQVLLPQKPTPIYRTGIEIFWSSEWEILVYRLKKGKWCIGEPLKRLAMPEGTRIVALFRQNQLLHPSGSTVLEVDDTLCVLGQEKDLDALSFLFSEAPEDTRFQRYFGDFFLDVHNTVEDVATFYGIDVSKDEAPLTLKALIVAKLTDKPVLGDSFEWKGFHWIVADVDKRGVTKLGLTLPKAKEE